MKILFSQKYSNLSVNLVALILRVGFGVLMIPNHGYAKLVNFADRKNTFMSFLGLGSTISLSLVIFAEVFCSILLILGLFTRFATIPLLITTLVIFSVKKWSFLGDQELVSAFFLAYLSILILGPGRFSLDAILLKR